MNIPIRFLVFRYLVISGCSPLVFFFFLAPPEELAVVEEEARVCPRPRGRAKCEASRVAGTVQDSVETIGELSRARGTLCAKRSCVWRVLATVRRPARAA